MARERKTYTAPALKGSQAMRADGWFNVMTGLNTRNADKRRAARHATRRVSEFEAEDIWRGDHFIARAVETVPRMMLRNGFMVHIGDDSPAPKPPPPDDLERMDRWLSRYGAWWKKYRLDADGDALDTQKSLAQKCNELDVPTVFMEAMEHARASGGAAILPITDELRRAPKNQIENALAKPLDLARLGEVHELLVLRPHECWPIGWYGDGRYKNYGTPSRFRVVRDKMGGAGQNIMTVHESRLLRFYGITTSRRQMAMNNSWGESILNRFVEVASDLHAAYQNAGVLIQDFAQAVAKVKGLTELIIAGDDKTVTKRAELVDQMRSTLRTLLIDAEDDFSRQQTPMSGLPETIDRLSEYFAAAAEMPVMILLGRSAEGLNATGDANIRAWYDSVAQQREQMLRPKLNTLLRWLMLSKEGPTGGTEPASWRVEFAPLWQPTEVEVAQARLAWAQACDLWIGNQTLTPEEVADSTFGGEKFSMEIKLNTDLREKMRAAHTQAVQLQETSGSIPDPNAKPGTATTPEAQKQQQEAELKMQHGPEALNEKKKPQPAKTK